MREKWREERREERREGEGGRGKEGGGRRERGGGMMEEEQRGRGRGEERREEVCHVYSMLHYCYGSGSNFLLVKHFVGGAESHLCNNIV